ncbi:MAG: extracellular solute-binding protein [bacterium]|nr:extracellular solute-binding protein [bacterium]
MDEQIYSATPFPQPAEQPPVVEQVQEAPPPPAKPPRNFSLLKKFGIALGVVLLLGLIILGVQKIFGGKGKNENVTLTYWGLADEASTMAPLIAKFETENPLVKINYIKQSSQDYRERLLNSLSKGSGPDIFRFHNTWVPMFSNHLSTIPPEILDTQAYQKDFYPVASQDLRRGAGLAGIPLEIDGIAMYVNLDIFEAEKKLVPATWDELRRVAGELTQRDKDGQITRAGVALGRTDNVDHWQDILGLMLLQNGADPANPNTTLGQDALAFFTVFSATDRVWDETLPSSTQAFANGKTAIYFGPSWRAGGLKLANPNLRFKVVPMPQLPKSTPTQPNVNYANYWAEGVWSKSKGQTEAWKFLKYLSSQEVLSARYQFMSAAGLNGEPYSRTDMATQIIEDPYLGAYVQQGNSYKSWYMASSTFDGSTGLNSRLSAVYAKAVATALDNRTPEEALTPVAAEVGQILAGYGVK